MKKQATKKTYSEDYVGAMLEEIRSNFKVFGEGLSGVQVGLNEIKDDLSNVKEDLKMFKLETRSNFAKVFEFQTEAKDNLSTTLEYLSKIDDEITEIKAELEKGKKAGKMEESWFKKIEQRVSIVEKQLKSQKILGSAAK